MKNLAYFLTPYLFLFLLSCGSEGVGKYNLIPDQPDASDEGFISSLGGQNLPSAINLRDLAGAFPPAFNQGDINSCTANAASAALYYDMNKQKWRKPFVPSRLFIYYNERKIEDKLDESKYGFQGAPVSMRDCIKTIHTQGFCKESLWPYESNKIYTEPTAAVYDSAKLHKTYKYRRIDSNLKDLKSCLAEGYPFLLGLHVYQSFEDSETRKTGIVPMPAEGETPIGGHAVLMVGYDDAKQQFIFRNSYGEDWGDQGYGFMPYDFVMKYCFDFWVINKIN